ncbi:hypothetical protein [Romboutsia lituseburensis]|uniref:hypothetical protein n=1 Tax=Romboutsia lituseburensis TaxID=1537 RepID=UPI0022EA6298|nr:hypothetical protein [Romboutsia lituseburensis]
MKILINGYTVNEHLKLDIDNKFLKYLDKSIKHIRKNKLMYARLVLLIALTIDLSTLNVFADNLNAIDKAGNEILNIIRKVGYWVGIILCSKDIIKHCMRGHIESIGTVIAMYGMGFGALYFLPWLFDLIKGIF